MNTKWFSIRRISSETDTFLKSYSETKGIQFRAFILDKQFVHIIVEEEINVIKAELKTCSIAEVIKEIVATIMLLIFFALIIVNGFGIAIDPVSNVRPHSNPERITMVTIKKTCLPAVATKVNHRNKVRINISCC